MRKEKLTLDDIKLETCSNIEEPIDAAEEEVIDIGDPLEDELTKGFEELLNGLTEEEINDFMSNEGDILGDTYPEYDETNFSNMADLMMEEAQHTRADIAAFKKYISRKFNDTNKNTLSRLIVIEEQLTSLCNSHKETDVIIENTNKKISEWLDNSNSTLMSMTDKVMGLTTSTARLLQTSQGVVEALTCITGKQTELTKAQTELKKQHRVMLLIAVVTLVLLAGNVIFTLFFA